MYIYIYDEFINNGRYDKSIHKIEKRLTDLGLNGKTIRLGITKNIKSAINDEIRQGAKTIIAVGNDKTTAKIINIIAGNENDEKNNLCLGIIPLEEKESQLAKTFGINNINDACEILLSRRVESFQLAAINNDYFLFKAEADLNEAVLEIDKNFIIQPIKQAKMEILNNPKDENNKKLLNLKIKEREAESCFSFQGLILANNESPVLTDNSIQITPPVKIFLSKEKIKIIVGKNRKV